MFPKNAYYFFSQAQIPRALPYLELHKIGIENHLNGEAISTIAASLQQAKNLANQSDRIINILKCFVFKNFYKTKDLLLIKKLYFINN